MSQYRTVGGDRGTRFYRFLLVLPGEPDREFYTMSYPEAIAFSEGRRAGNSQLSMNNY